MIRLFYFLAAISATFVLASLGSFLWIVIDPVRRYRRWRSKKKLPTLSDVPEARIIQLCPGKRKKKSA